MRAARAKARREVIAAGHQEALTALVANEEAHGRDEMVRTRALISIALSLSAIAERLEEWSG